MIAFNIMQTFLGVAVLFISVSSGVKTRPGEPDRLGVAPGSRCNRFRFARQPIRTMTCGGGATYTWDDIQGIYTCGRPEPNGRYTLVFFDKSTTVGMQRDTVWLKLVDNTLTFDHAEYYNAGIDKLKHVC